MAIDPYNPLQYKHLSSQLIKEGLLLRLKGILYHFLINFLG